MEHRKPSRPRVASSIRAARRRAGISPGVLASIVGVDSTYIAHLEAGRRHASPLLAARLAVALGLPTESLTQ